MSQWDVGQQFSRINILNVPEEFLLMKTSTSRILQENIKRGSNRGRFIYSLRNAKHIPSKWIKGQLLLRAIKLEKLIYCSFKDYLKMHYSWTKKLFRGLCSRKHLHVPSQVDADAIHFSPF